MFQDQPLRDFLALDEPAGVTRRSMQRYPRKTDGDGWQFLDASCSGSSEWGTWPDDAIAFPQLLAIHLHRCIMWKVFTEALPLGYYPESFCLSTPIGISGGKLQPLNSYGA